MVPTSALDGVPNAADGLARVGKYTLISKLAAGGMGEVYVALMSGAAGFEKQVVVKRLLPHHSQRERSVKMFVDEARLTARLNHPNICQVFELIQVSGEYYLAMEYLEGIPVSRLIGKQAKRGVDPRVVAGIVIQACHGLDHAHSFRDDDLGVDGIIHRDISPSNLILTVAGGAKVLDFGIAKLYREGSQTVTGGLKGKYSYMSPEQIHCEPLDQRSDLFSLGIVMFEAMTGKRLFRRDSELDTMQAIIHGDRPRLREVREDVPEAVEAVVERALSLARDDRYESARALSRALKEAVEPLGGPASVAELADYVQREHGEQIAEQRAKIGQSRTRLATRAPTDTTSATTQAEATATTPVNPSYHGGVPPGSYPPGAVVQAGVHHGSGGYRTDPTGPMGLPAVSRADFTNNRFELISPGTPLQQRKARLWIAAMIVSALLLMFVIGRYSTSSEQNADQPSHWLVAESDDSASDEPADSRPPPDRPDDSQPTVAEPDVQPTGDDLAAADDATAVSPAGADDADGESSGDASDAEEFPPDVVADWDDQAGDNTSAGDPPPAATKAKGYFTIDASPYATVYIDGRKVGVTPMVRLALPPGRHAVRLVTAKGAVRKFTVKIASRRTTIRRVDFNRKRGKR